MSKLAITPHAGTVKIVWEGHVVASSRKALDLREGDAAAVIYVPRADAEMSFFTRTVRTTHCPYKGDANYFSLHCGDARADDVVWTYEKPLEGAEAIKDHLAFYPNRVTIEA